MKVTLLDLGAMVTKAHAPLGEPWLDSLWERHKEHTLTRINYYRFLYHLVRFRQPEVAIELGVEYGQASAHMAVAAATYGGMVIGADLINHGVPRDEIPVHCPNYTFFIGDSIAVFPLIEAYCTRTGFRVGVIFQDSSHHYETSKEEWQLYSSLLDHNAVWVCDDITPAFHDPNVDPPGKGMVEYFAELPGQKTLFADVLHRGNTIGVMIL